MISDDYQERRMRSLKKLTQPCPVCGGCISYSPSRMQTLVGYFSFDGHMHDDNCITGVYECENKHTFLISKRRTCSKPGCDWEGKEQCFCHQGKKLDEWPEDGGIILVEHLQND